MVNAHVGARREEVAAKPQTDDAETPSGEVLTDAYDVIEIHVCAYIGGIKASAEAKIDLRIIDAIEALGRDPRYFICTHGAMVLNRVVEEILENRVKE